MHPQAQSLLSELDDRLSKVPSSRQLMLRQLTDLFVAGSPTYQPEHVSVFDAVFRRLTDGVEPRARIELSGRLANFDSPPADIIIRLSIDDDGAVAGPVLEKSNVLSDGMLVCMAIS